MRQNDFASEYIDMIRADVPDLWSRIEAKIDEKAEAAKAETTKEEATEVTAEVKPEAVTEEKAKAGAATPVITAEPEQAQQSPKIRKFRWQPYAGVAAAAAICFLVAIPVLNGARNASTATSESMKAAEPAAAADFASNDAAESSAQSEAATDSMAAAEAPEAEDLDEILSLAGGEKTDRTAEQNATYSSNASGKEEFTAAMEAEESDNEAPAPGADVCDDDTAEAAGSGQGAAGDGGQDAVREGILLYGGSEVSNATILVSVVPGTAKEAVEKLAAKYGLSIRYDYDGTDMYALALDVPAKDEAELKELLAALCREKIIETAEPDGISHIN